MTPADHANEEPRLMFCVCDDTPCSCGAFYSQPTPADHANTMPDAPPGWKTCPHCLGSGLVQADDTRPTVSPLGKKKDA